MSYIRQEVELNKFKNKYDQFDIEELYEEINQKFIYLDRIVNFIGKKDIKTAKDYALLGVFNFNHDYAMRCYQRALDLNKSCLFSASRLITLILRDKDISINDKYNTIIKITSGIDEENFSKLEKFHTNVAIDLYNLGTISYFISYVQKYEKFIDKHKIIWESKHQSDDHELCGKINDINDALQFFNTPIKGYEIIYKLCQEIKRLQLLPGGPEYQAALERFQEASTQF